MYVNALDAQHKLPAVNEELPVPHHFIVELHYILFVTPDGKKQNKTKQNDQPTNQTENKEEEISLKNFFQLVLYSPVFLQISSDWTDFILKMAKGKLCKFMR